MDKHEATSSRASAPASGARAGSAAEKILVALFVALLVAVSGASVAGQLSLTNSPLFLTVPVPSNIFFLHDDSGSMDWGLVTSENNGIMTLGYCGFDDVYYYTHPGASGGSVKSPAKNNSSDAYILATEAALAAAGVASPYGGVWRAWNKDYNKLYYNPDVDYKPWQGVNVSGATYSDADINNAPFNPYRPGDGTLPLTADTSYSTGYCPPGSGTGTYITPINVTVYPARYYYWSGTGTPAAGDSHTLVEIKSSTPTCSSNGNVQPCLKRAYAAEIQNFANWFSYYRKRNLTAKNAIGKVIGQAQSEVRMGHATLNNNGGSSNVNIKIEQMNASVSSGNKKALLDALYKVETSASSGTPLRTKLDEAGKYYECAANNIFGTSAPSPCPIATNASGGSCQQNFTVLMTDGYWNDTFSLGNVDADNNSPNAAGNTTFDGGAYADGYSDTLADVAMHYYERDLAPGLSNAVPITAGVDEATHQHMVTYGVAFGVAGALSANPPNRTDAFVWPAVASNTSSTIDDLRHAAYNGRGQFLSADRPDDLTTALQNAIGSIGDRTGSSASVAVNSRSLSTTTRLYQARFTSGEWSGDLRALAVNASGDVSTQVWSAKDQLKLQDWNTGGTGRVILTRGSTAGVAFQWTAMNASQQADLNDDPTTTAVDSDGKGENRLKWLRGDSTNEGTGANFRVRTSSFKLGDIVDSSPIYVGAPPALPNLETTPHSDFRSAYASRREMVYVGANDGMLHGFDAATGQEKIAYVPSVLFPELSKLTNSSYAHRYYVNASPTVGDAYGTFTNVSGVCATGCWRTVLAGGLGNGGKGIYALDVTDPDGSVTSVTINGTSTTAVSTALLAFNEGNAAKIALWELTATGTNASNMGYVYGQPTITKVKTSATDYAWAVIFGNGYNSANENAVLYVVNAVTGAVIRDIPLVAPGYSATGNSNGLSMPAVVDTDGNYVADRVYAGDLRGNLWRVDLTDNNPNNWKSAYGTAANPEPLFKAVDGTTTTTVEQPITIQPEVGAHPDGKDGYMVYFGTGRYVATSDNQANTSPIQTFYGIWDRGDVSQIPRSKLLPQTISAATTANSITVRQVTNDTINWCTANNTDTCTCDNTTSGRCLGWRDNLLTATAGSLGEKAVSNPVLVGGTVPRIIFTTLIPETDACTAGGTSWLMELNPKNGGRLGEQVFDSNLDGTLTSSDMITGGIPVAGINPGKGIMPEPTIIRDSANKTDLKAETGSSGAVVTLKNYVSGTQGGRQSWRQLK